MYRAIIPKFKALTPDEIGLGMAIGKIELEKQYSQLQRSNSLAMK